MDQSPWALTPDELTAAERGHREMMATSGEQIRPIRMSADGVNLRAQAETIAAELIEQYGTEYAEAFVAGAFQHARADHYHRMSLQPGATKNVNGKTYVLNRNHRWTLPRGNGGGPQRPARRPMPTAPQRPAAGQAAQAPSQPPPQPKPQQPQADTRRPDAGSKPPRPRPPQLRVNVEADRNNDGVTDAARVGVPAFSVPPPPKQIPRIPGLKGTPRKAEESFATYFEADPDKVTSDALELFKAMAGEGKPVTFGTDDAKVLSPFWNSDQLESDLEARSRNRATLNTALHQTANAITKRAFLKHLDTLPKGSEIMVTVGGCGAGKGYALKNVPQALEVKNRAAAVWDSAGDQNATENPWILKEASRRGLKVNYVYVHADPETQWAHPDRGVVKRAQDPNDGRMVDAKVFADSYAIGAKNHHNFAKRNANNPAANFIFLKNGSPPELLDGMPPEALKYDRRALAKYATKVVQDQNQIPPHVRTGALQGTKIWKD